MPSGWTRWLLERFEFPFEVIYPPQLDRGNLRDKFDVILLPDGAFSRQLFLGDSLDAGQLSADYEAGVLTITIPVAEQAKPRKIEIGSRGSRQQISS